MAKLLFLFSFWDERFLFECNEKSNQIHLQIIDRKAASKRPGSNYSSLRYSINTNQ